MDTNDELFLSWKEGNVIYGLYFEAKSDRDTFLQLIRNFDRHPTNLARTASKTYLTNNSAVLDLTGRSLNINDIQSLSSELQKSTLKELHLPSCNIGNEGVKLLCSAITNNKSITKLNLRANSINSKAAEYIGSLLKTNQVILEMDLSRNNLNSTAMHQIAKALEANHRLSVLNLSTNNINDDATRFICQSLMKNFTLEQLVLEGNEQKSILPLMILGNPMSNDSSNMIKLCFAQRKIPQLAVVRQDWDSLKKFVRDNPQVQLSGIIPKEVLNLHNRMQINKITLEALSTVLPQLKSTSKKVNENVHGLASKFKRLKEEEKSLEERLKLLKKEMVDLANEYKLEQSNSKVSENILNKTLRNYQNSQSFIQLNQAKIDDWKQQMSVEMSKWNTDDILFLLNEIQLTHRSKIFIDNKIDGSVVTSLTSNDLTKRGMTFKESKLLLKSLYLIQKFKNLYVDPPAVFKWTAQEVFNWLNANNFANLAPIFKQKEISGSELVFLDRSDLESHLDIKSLGDCIKLEKAIRELYGIHLDRGSDNKIKAPSPRQAIVTEQFYCPITHEIMTDPVVTSDGHTYERSAIESWLKNHNTSPVTNQPLEHKGLVPSYSLKSMIMDFLAHQNK